jgi:hypothetical protein
VLLSTTTQQVVIPFTSILVLPTMAPLQTDEGVEILGTTKSLDRHISGDKTILSLQSGSNRKSSSDGKYL